MASTRVTQPTTVFAPARQVIAQNLIDPLFNDPDLIRIAQLGDDVCLIGAALHAREKLKA